MHRLTSLVETLIASKTKPSLPGLRALLLLTLIANVGCSNSNNPPAGTDPMQTGADVTMTENESVDDMPVDIPADTNTDVDDVPIQVNTEVASMLPGRSTVFGEDINTFPNPNQILGGELLIWRYRVVNDQLTADEFEPPLSHQLIWQRYAELIPYEYRKRLVQVSFEANPVEANGASYAVVNGNYFEETPGLQESWLYIREPMVEEFYLSHIGGVSPREYLNTTVFIHEQGHVLHNDHIVNQGNTDESELYLISPTIRRDSVIATYYENFWLGEVYEFWQANISQTNGRQLVLDEHPNHFVSDYAATNVLEDFAESFSVFVETDSIPSSGMDYRGAEKVIWFWRQPEYVTLRDQIRTAI